MFCPNNEKVTKTEVIPNSKMVNKSQSLLAKLVTPTLKMLSQGIESKASLEYLGRLCLKTNKQTKMKLNFL